MTTPPYLLSIAIPTFNRAAYLEKCLESIRKEQARLKNQDRKLVKIIVRDNASTDETQQIIKFYSELIDNLDTYRNTENLGPDENIARCYENNDGQYVLVLGDDDSLVPGVLEWLLKKIRERDYALIFLRAYSSNENNIRPPFQFRKVDRILSDDDLVSTLADRLTFISSMVLKRSLIGSPSEHIGTHLVQTYAALNAVNQMSHCVISARYWISVTRANGGVVENGVRTGLPSIVCVFVENFFKAAKSYRKYQLIENKFKRTFFLRYFLYELARRNEKITPNEFNVLLNEYETEWYFRLLSPLFFPNFTSAKRNIILVISFFVRIINGELFKILNYFFNKQKL